MIRFDGRVAIVTGAGAGLGRAHAMALAARGAHVVVNDLGEADAAAVAAEIVGAGGRATAHAADVSDADAVNAMVGGVLAALGRVDVVVNNAGILRDKTFQKLALDDFRAVLDVHLMGSVHLTQAVWPAMREAGYGRVVFTSSASGLYGNFGQSNYGAAKAAMVGLMQVLSQEGARYDIRVNTLASTATTQMTDGLLPPEAAPLLAPETITPGLLWLVSDDAPSGMILAAGAGCFSETLIMETRGIVLTGDDLTPETVSARASDIRAHAGAERLDNAFAQTRNFARRAAAAQGLPLPWDQ